jgi:hypothetical protein
MAVTLRRLADEVAWALDAYDRDPDRGVPGPPPADVDVALRPFPAEDEEEETAAAESGTAPADTNAAQAKTAPTPADTDPTPAGAAAAARATGAAPHPPICVRVWQLAAGETVVRFRGPASALGVFREALAAYTRPGERLWQSFGRMLCDVEHAWRAEPRHPNPVPRRDRWRCQVPACTSRRNLHEHHVQFRSRGGTNALVNRITLCAAHHLRGIHAGWVRAWGVAPRGIHWLLGLRPDGPPLAELMGDRYVRRRR